MAWIAFAQEDSFKKTLEKYSSNIYSSTILLTYPRPSVDLGHLAPVPHLYPICVVLQQLVCSSVRQTSGLDCVPHAHDDLDTANPNSLANEVLLCGHFWVAVVMSSRAVLGTVSGAWLAKVIAMRQSQLLKKSAMITAIQWNRNLMTTIHSCKNLITDSVNHCHNSLLWPWDFYSIGLLYCQGLVP